MWNCSASVLGSPKRMSSEPARVRCRAAWRWLPVARLVGVTLVLATPGLLSYMMVDRFRMDANHFWVALAVIAVSVWAASHARLRLQRAVYTLVAITSACGVAMLRFTWLEIVNRFAYTAFDLGLTLLAACTGLALVKRLMHFDV